MEQSPTTSQEKLDRMLASGAITAEDYRRLSQAMLASDAAEASDALGAPAAKRLRKNWARRQLAGVCAGFADYFALDPVIVRIIAVALTVVTGPVAPLCYLVLAVMLPRDESATTHAAHEAPPATHVAPPVTHEARPALHAWRFGLCALLLFEVVPLCLGLLVGTRLEAHLFDPETDAISGMPVWVAGHSGRMWELCDNLSSYFSSPPAPAHVAWLASAALAAFGASLLTVLYLACRRCAARLLWVVLWAVAALSCSLFLYVGLCLPLFQYIERI